LFQKSLYIVSLYNVNWAGHWLYKKHGVFFLGRRRTQTAYPSFTDTCILLLIWHRRRTQTAYPSFTILTRTCATTSIAPISRN
jgi:hypothetical protein